MYQQIFIVKKLAFGALLAGTLFFSACSEISEEPADAKASVLLDSKVVFDGSEGDPISLKLASSWTANYQRANPGAVVAHYMGGQMIEKLLKQPAAKGIRIYRGLYENGERVTVWMAANAQGDDLKDLVADFAKPCPPFCPKGDSRLIANELHRFAKPAKVDGSEGDEIQLSKANSWIANYKEAHPKGVWGHFAGAEILEEIVTQAGAVGMRVYYAIDDAGAETLILVGVDAEGNDMTDGILGEYISPCPSTC